MAVFHTLTRTVQRVTDCMNKALSATQKPNGAVPHALTVTTCTNSLPPPPHTYTRAKSPPPWVTTPLESCACMHGDVPQVLAHGFPADVWFAVYYPVYDEPTSAYHPLRGFVLIDFWHGGESPRGHGRLDDARAPVVPPGLVISLRSFDTCSPD